MKARFGTKQYAAVVLREEERAYAKARRKAAQSVSYSLISDRTEANARFLGAWSALAAVGAISHEQADRWMRRHLRIQAAKVTRRPFAEVRRAA